MDTVQPDLFTDEPYRGHAPYVMGSDTSVEAAKSQDKSAAPDRAKVLAFLTFMPATDEEIQRSLKMDGNTERPRRRELELAGKIVDSGKRRKTSTGSPAIVWKVK